MLTSIATVSLSGTLESKLQAVAAAGFDGVEIFENDLLAFPGSAADVARIIADLGLRCTLFQPFRDFEGMPAALRERVFDRAERKFDLMGELGAPLLLVCSNVSPEALGDRARMVDDLRELGDRAAAHSIRIGYEALAWGRHVYDHRAAWELVEQAGHESVGLILDSFHSLVRRIPIDSLRAIDPDRIFIVQLADAPWLELDYLSWSRHFRNLPGQGDIPVRAFVSQLLEIGYRGPLSLEIFNDRFREIPAQSVAVDGYRSLRLSIDESARFSGLAVPEAMPPRVECSGIEFVEFAVGDEEAAALRALLSAMGFVETGRHRSKKVARWQQGDVNFVINSDPEGFGHSYNLMHGPSVCALCFRVRDVGGATARAAALAIDSFEGRVGRGEMKVPALRDVAGGLVYLVEEGRQDELWERDFVPTGAGGEAGAGLRRVDHVAYAMGEDEFLSWLLYVFALFKVDKAEPVEIADPFGLVHVQSVESEDRRFRLVASATAAARTLAARLRSRYLGAGVQYISLATPDVFATAEAMSQLGTDRLEIPLNYYDDLGARFGLDDALIARLQAHDILYDRGADGECFQFYTRAFDRRFFFEIIERRGYDGYGHANAAIRMAAQSRLRPVADTLP